MGSKSGFWVSIGVGCGCLFLAVLGLTAGVALIVLSISKAPPPPADQITLPVPDNPRPERVPPIVKQAPVKPSSRLTSENYDRLKHGMTFDEVTDILGMDCKQNVSSAMADHSSQMYTWQEAFKVVTVQFLDGKAVTFAKAGF